MNLDDEYNCHLSRSLTSCLETFGNSIFPGNGHFDQVCRILSTHSSDSVISSLYCCNLNCGIKFDKGVGHYCKSANLSKKVLELMTALANINIIINRCKRLYIRIQLLVKMKY